MPTNLSTYIENKQSFFLYAGAGSGKTYQLVELLKYIRESIGLSLRRSQQKVAVVTYTNAATDEIKRRIGYDDLFDISTIHSFAWEMIKPFQENIRKCQISRINEKIAELEQKQAGARNTQATIYLDRQEKINHYKEKIGVVSEVGEFIYNPNGDNDEKNSLNHSDVIDIGATMFGMPLLQRIMMQRYPYIMIDESQDTQKEVMLALIDMAKKNKGRFTLGLFGDVKQQIYMDGVPNMESQIPEDWGRPVIADNYRSSNKIVTLANSIAREMQNEEVSRQEAKITEYDGCKRLFLIDNGSNPNKEQIETDIADKMTTEANDPSWNIPSEVKILILEHRMAAVRMGFENFYDKLYNVERYRDDFLKGESPDTRTFLQAVFPILEAHGKDDQERILLIVKEHCLLLKGENFLSIGKIKEINEKLKVLVGGLVDKECSIGRAIKLAQDSGLFKVHEVLLHAIDPEYIIDEENFDNVQKAILAWREVLDLPLTEFYHYFEYVTERSRFATHQGVKGLEFNRVMVIYDDAGSRGRSFSYEKLFGTVELSVTDLRNQQEGKETTIDRTRRLLYVTCTRARESLALVVYTNNPQIVKQSCLDKGWFDEDEIVEM